MSIDKGFFGPYGGQFVPETLIPALDILENEFSRLKNDADFLKELKKLSETYAGRPTPIFFAERLSEKAGFEIYLKREDLMHTGSHKLNNTLGQSLLTKHMGKKRIIAETGAGQHGVATATVAALFGLECVVYMGEVDIERQQPNVQRMKMLGTEVRPVKDGSRTLKDATSAALKDWVATVDTTHYIIGSVVGPHPFPEMVAFFQSVIGFEAKQQCTDLGFTPASVVACVGGGSNAIGLFKGFVDDENVKLYGVEAGGFGIKDGEHARSIGLGKDGILHGSLTSLLQDDNRQVKEVHSIAAGLDYPGIGPEHAYLNHIKRAEYGFVTDEQAVKAFHALTRLEGIIPAIESSHAVAFVLENAEMFKGQKVLVNLSGRGDKDAARELAEMGGLK